MRLLALASGLAIAGIVVLADTGGLQPIVAWIATVRGGDKIAHFLIMGTWAALAVLALGRRRSPRRAAQLGGGCVGVLVLAEEISQHWIPTRSFDLLDLMADALGIAIGTALAHGWLRRRGAAERSSKLEDAPSFSADDARGSPLPDCARAAVPPAPRSRP